MTSPLAPVTAIKGPCPAWPFQEGLHVPEQPHADFEPTSARILCEKIAAGGNVTVSFSPQVPFRSLWLAIDPDCLDLLVTDVRVGKNSCLASHHAALAGAWPTLPFELSPKAYGAWFERLSTPFDTCQISQILSVHVTNPHREPRAFRATVWGVAVGGEENPPIGSQLIVPTKARTGFYPLGIGSQDDRGEVTYVGTQSQIPLKLDTLVLRAVEGVDLVGFRAGGKRFPLRSPTPSSVFAPHPFALPAPERKLWEEAHEVIAGIPTLQISQIAALELRVRKRPIEMWGTWRGRAVA